MNRFLSVAVLLLIAGFSSIALAQETEMEVAVESTVHVEPNVVAVTPLPVPPIDPMQVVMDLISGLQAQIDSLTNRIQLHEADQADRMTRVEGAVESHGQEIVNLYDGYDALYRAQEQYGIEHDQTESRLSDLGDVVTDMQANSSAGPTFVMVHLEDDAQGAAKGWNPGTKTGFFINEDAVKKKSVITYTLIGSNPNPCWISEVKIEKGFELHCEKKPTDGTMLNYMVATP